MHRDPRHTAAGAARHSGVALLLLLIISAAVAGLAAAYLATTSVRMAASNNYAAAIDLAYAAESGVHHGLCLLAENPSLLSGSNTTPLGPYAGRTGGPTYTISSLSIGNNQYRLTGAGVLGTSKRTCAAVARLDNTFVQTLVSLGPHMYWRLGDANGIYAAEQMVNYGGVYAGSVLLGQTGALTGDAGASVKFDGSRTRVVIAHDPSMAVAQGSYVLWYYDNSPFNNEALLSKEAQGRGTGGFLSIGAENGQIHVNLKSASADNKISITGLSNDAWTLLTVTFGPAGLKLYVNGQLAGTNAYTGGMTNNSEPLVLAASQSSRDAADLPYLPYGFYSAGLTNFFSGRLEEVAFFNRALSATEVSRLYAARRAMARVLQWQT